MTQFKKALIAAGVLALALPLAGCQWEAVKDAPRATVDESSAARVLRMPDGFSNVATKCVDGVRYATIYHSAADTQNGNYGAVSMILDPRCAA